MSEAAYSLAVQGPAGPSSVHTSGITPKISHAGQSCRGDDVVTPEGPPSGVQLTYLPGVANVVPIEAAGPARRYSATVAREAEDYREGRARHHERRAARVEVRTLSGRWRLCDTALTRLGTWTDPANVGKLCTRRGKDGHPCCAPGCEAEDFKRQLARLQRKGYTWLQALNVLQNPASPREAQRAGEWHRGRAKGKREAPARLMGCGRDGRVISVTCTCCGEHRDMAARCSMGLLCSICRKKIARRVQKRFFYARHATLVAAGQRGLRRSRRAGNGTWRERFVTLTVPHRENNSIAERIELGWEAYRRFSDSMRRWLKEREKEDGAKGIGAYFRRFEWTPGSGKFDAYGHPHFHLWVFAPFLPYELILLWWARALRKAGAQVAIPFGVPRRGFATMQERRAWVRNIRSMRLPMMPNVDVRPVRGNEVESRDPQTGKKKRDPLAAELIKYITKEFISGPKIEALPGLAGADRRPRRLPGERLPAKDFAAVYECVDGRRLSQCSRGFMGKADKTKWCGDCARPVGFFRVQLVNTWNVLVPRPAALGERAGPKDGVMTEDEMLRQAKLKGCAVEARIVDGKFAGYREVYYSPEDRERALERRRAREKEYSSDVVA